MYPLLKEKILIKFLNLKSNNAHYTTIIQMNYLTKGLKYLMFVGIKSLVAWLVKYDIIFINVNFSLSGGFLINKMLFGPRLLKSELAEWC